MDKQITWHCPIVNITTSAAQTCSFQPPVHAFRVLMNKNTSPPQKEPGKMLCEALGLELYNIKYYPSSFIFFIRLIFMPKAQTPYIIKFSPEDYCFHRWKYRQSMATRTITIVLKNMVQPCRCPFTRGWFFGPTGRNTKPHRPQVFRFG